MEFTDSPWSTPSPEDRATLGVVRLQEQPNLISIDCGYPVQVFRDFHDSLRKTIARFRPDIVWTQLEGANSIVAIAKECEVQALFYLRDAEIASDELKSISRAGARIVCNSRFLAGHVRKMTGARTSFIYPSLNGALNAVGDKNGYLTMINAHPVKGLDTFLEIAKCLPEEKFLLVESWPLGGPGLQALESRLTATPNVRFLRRVSDMRQVYGKTKLLLVPSIWEEAFGRVVIEAQSCSIPVVASARGGLQEAVGDGGICIRDFRNPKSWVDTIASVLTDKARFEMLAKRAYAHSTSEIFTQRYAAGRFFQICSDVVERRGAFFGPLRELMCRLRSR
jgi:glycosyltransferase involved in cell wall biosynthesis